MGTSGLLASNRSYLAEILIQRRTCELPDSSSAKEEGTSFGVKSSLTGPTGLDTGDDYSFTDTMMKVLSDCRGNLNWGG